MTLTVSQWAAGDAIVSTCLGPRHNLTRAVEQARDEARAAQPVLEPDDRQEDDSDAMVQGR